MIYRLCMILTWQIVRMVEMTDLYTYTIFAFYIDMYDYLVYFSSSLPSCIFKHGCINKSVVLGVLYS